MSTLHLNKKISEIANKKISESVLDVILVVSTSLSLYISFLIFTKSSVLSESDMATLVLSLLAAQLLSVYCCLHVFITENKLFKKGTRKEKQ